MKKNKTRTVPIIWAVIIGIFGICIILMALYKEKKPQEEVPAVCEERVPDMHSFDRIEVEGMGEVHEVMDELLKDYSCVWVRRLPSDSEDAEVYMITYSNCQNGRKDCPYQSGMGCAETECTEKEK